MSSRFDNVRFPNLEDFYHIYEEKREQFAKIDINAIKCPKLLNWKLEYHNRVINLIDSYVLVKFYYNLGIPDKEWRQDTDGRGVRFLADVQGEYENNLYWFGFYTNVYYNFLFSIVDAFYHVINIKYDLGIKSAAGFKYKVKSKLKDKDEMLYDYIVENEENEIYSKACQYRNDFTHNYRPNQVKVEVENIEINSKINHLHQTLEKEICTRTRGWRIKEEYTPSSEMLKNIEESLSFLGDFISRALLIMQESCN